MNRTRLVKLERQARERPCPGCGRMYRPPAASGREADLERLSVAEQDELARLVGAVTTPACPRCGRAGHDLTRLTEHQLRRTLRLMRALFGRQYPALAAACDPDTTERDGRRQSEPCCR